MLLPLSSRLYKYLPTNGQGNLRNVSRNAGEGEGLNSSAFIEFKFKFKFLYRVFFFLFQLHILILGRVIKEMTIMQRATEKNR